MSRLERNQKKQLKRYGFFLAIIFGLGILFGPHLLINTGVFIAELGRPKTTNETDLSGKFVVAPEIFDVPDATNSAVLQVTGRSPKGNLVLFVNGKRQKDIGSTDGDFDTTVDLREGENDIYLELKNEKTKITKKSEVYKVSYIFKKPRLDVSSPKSGDKVNKDEVAVTGTTDPNVTIHVNEAPTVINSKGEFSASVRLNGGENKIKVEAIDVAGNVTMNEISVIYERDE